MTCWPPGAGGAVGVHADIGRVELHLVDRVHFGQDRNRDGGSVDAALRLGLRDPLHAVRARLVLQPRVGALADDAADDFLEAAFLAVVAAEDLDFPALRFGVSRIHAKQLAGKQCRLVAAGGRADLEEDVAVVVGIAGISCCLMLELELLQFATSIFSSSAPSARISGSGSCCMLGSGQLVGLLLVGSCSLTSGCSCAYSFDSSRKRF